VLAVISEMAGTAAPSSSADWKHRNPAKVPAAAAAAQPLTSAAAP
jgi:hypothetical protein